MEGKTNILLDGLSWFFKPIDWPRELYANIKEWYIVRKVCKEPQTQKLLKTFKPELRTDKIGRIYTVVNIPEEMYKQEFTNARQTFLIDQLRKIEEVTLRLGISEILYPQYTLINNVPDSFAYLLVLETEKDAFSIVEFGKWLIKAFLWYCVIAAINAFVISITGSSILGLIGSIF